MKRNVGGLDRIGRIVVSIALLAFGHRNRGTTIGTVAFIGGADLLATVVIQRCPVDALPGIDTCSRASRIGRRGSPRWIPWTYVVVRRHRTV